MSDYKIGRDIEDLSRRVAEIEEKLWDTPTGDSEEKNSVFENMEVGKRKDGVKTITISWKVKNNKSMSYKFCECVLFENGEWTINSTLYDFSGDRKYRNEVIFTFREKSNRDCEGKFIGKLTMFVANFAPYERKRYPLEGDSGLVKAIFNSVENNEAEMCRTWYVSDR